MPRPMNKLHARGEQGKTLCGYVLALPRSSSRPLERKLARRREQVTCRRCRKAAEQRRDPLPPVPPLGPKSDPGDGRVPCRYCTRFYWDLTTHRCAVPRKKA